MRPQDNSDLLGPQALLCVLVPHTPRRHQDAALAEQSAAAGQQPERGLLRGPLVDGHGGSAGPGLGFGCKIRGRAHVDGGVPRPLGVRQVVRTEEAEPAADCGAAGRIRKGQNGDQIKKDIAVLCFKICLIWT